MIWKLVLWPDRRPLEVRGDTDYSWFIQIIWLTGLNPWKPPEWFELEVHSGWAQKFNVRVGRLGFSLFMTPGKGCRI